MTRGFGSGVTIRYDMRFHFNVRLKTDMSQFSLPYGNQGVVCGDAGGLHLPIFFDRGTRPPFPHFFGLKFVKKVSPLLQLVTY